MNNVHEKKDTNIHAKKTRVGSMPDTSACHSIILEGYFIRREIGRGGMAVVYEAVEKSLNRPVALKVLSMELSRDTDLIRRFVNEARAAAKLNHPNIVQVYSIGQEKGIYYFAMEYVRGESVEAILQKEKRIPAKKTVKIIRHTVLALEHAFKNNIVHRDVKPGNILITAQGDAKVADFGLAAEVRGASAVPGGKIIGTPFYISPEQAQGMEGDFRSDIYSLGITFYQMISGKLPFYSSDTKQLMKNHIHTPLPPLPSETPAVIKKLIYKMTQKAPEKRYKDYGDIVKELNKIDKALSGRRRTTAFLLTLMALSAAAAVYSFYYRPVIPELAVPLQTERDKRIEAIYKSVVEYARKNPESYNGIIKEYFRIVKQYPNTEWAFRAEQKMDMIISAVAKDARAELNALKPVRDKLIAESRYKDAVAKYEAVREKYKDTAAEDLAQENINYIIEQARKDFRARHEKAREYINNGRFSAARRIYEEIAERFGLKNFVNDAESKLRFIDEAEKEYMLKKKAEDIFASAAEKAGALVKEHRYSDAKKILKDADTAGGNALLSGKIKKKIEEINTMQIKYESGIIKDKMDGQYAEYKKITAQTAAYIKQYEYKKALTLVKKGIDIIDTSEWNKKLIDLEERLGYLMEFKQDIINGINKELRDKEITNIKATGSTLIFVVEGGYVGVPWKETSPERIYSTASVYIDSPMPLGVFCLTYGLVDNARVELTKALRNSPKLKNIVEKYFIELAEKQ